jgi:hypothetical protein
VRSRRAANIGDLAAEHRSGAKRLRWVAQAVESVLMDREVLRHTVDEIIRDFIVHERRQLMKTFYGDPYGRDIAPRASANQPRNVFPPARWIMRLRGIRP